MRRLLLLVLVLAGCETDDFFITDGDAACSSESGEPADADEQPTTSSVMPEPLTLGPRAAPTARGARRPVAIGLSWATGADVAGCAVNLSRRTCLGGRRVGLALWTCDMSWRTGCRGLGRAGRGGLLGRMVGALQAGERARGRGLVAGAEALLERERQHQGRGDGEHEAGHAGARGCGGEWRARTSPRSSRAPTGSTPKRSPTAGSTPPAAACRPGPPHPRAPA